MYERDAKWNNIHFKLFLCYLNFCVNYVQHSFHAFLFFYKCLSMFFIRLSYFIMVAWLWYYVVRRRTNEYVCHWLCFEWRYSIFFFFSSNYLTFKECNIVMWWFGKFDFFFQSDQVRNYWRLIVDFPISGSSDSDLSKCVKIWNVMNHFSHCLKHWFDAS